MTRPRKLVLLTLPILLLCCAQASAFVATPRTITNTTGGKNQNPSIDKTGKVVVFTSNVNDSGATTFDFNSSGNVFGPNPACVNCANTDGNGELYLWHAKPKYGDPANSFRQLTSTPAGGFNANRFADINQKATTVAWDSDQDHLSGGNADGNREIYLIDLATRAITQVTSTTGGGNTANENANLSDDGQMLVFDSSSDFSSSLNCKLIDGAGACNNADNNNEVMLYSRATNSLTQITTTSAGGGSANIRPRISNDGKYIAFQSTRDFGSGLVAGATCQLLGGGACDNADGNGEIMRYDVANKAFTQITKTVPAACAGSNPSERVEISKLGKYVSFQSKCESQLNPGGCGSCDGSDEAFLADMKKKTLTQLTISDAGFNRVPRISGSGRYIVFETKHKYGSQNTSSAKTLFILKRNTKPGNGTVAGRGQLVDDPGATFTQNPKVKATTIDFAGGFNSSIEQFGASTSGKYYAFDNAKGVGNQEIWFLDRTK